MRFDAACKECRYFMKKTPEDMDCANRLGNIWDPGKQACDNFVKRKP